MILDFKEIPQANGNDGLQDSFELFARDFLQMRGYRIIDDPARGADGKKDLIVEEVLVGVAHEKKIRWLVSCKHYIHKKSSVSDKDEINIRERLDQHQCDGFMGFYSTLPSNGLQNMLKGLPRWIVYDREKIESCLLERNPKSLQLAARYFPESFKKYQIENPAPAKLYDKLEPLQCECCGRNLFDTEYKGLYAMFYANSGKEINDLACAQLEQIKRVYFACKGRCDNILKRQCLAMGLSEYGWNDVSDLCIPSVWLSDIMGFINGVHDGTMNLDNEAFKKMKQLYIATFQYVARDLTTKEKGRLASLLSFDLV